MPWSDFLLELLWKVPLLAGAWVVLTVLLGRVDRSRRTGRADGAGAWSLECWARVLAGEHPQLARRWRVGRAVVSPGIVQLHLYRWGLRFTEAPPSAVDVRAVDRDGVQRAGWLADLRFQTSCHLVEVITASGSRLQLAVPAGDAGVVLDLLEGRPTPRALSPEEESEAHWPFPRTVTVTGLPAAHTELHDHTVDDVLAQLHRCLDDVERRLLPERMSLADLVGLRVRTTDSHAVTACVPEVAARLRDAGAAPSISVLAVRLPADGAQQVEVDATATAPGRRPDVGQPR